MEHVCLTNRKVDHFKPFACEACEAASARARRRQRWAAVSLDCGTALVTGALLGWALATGF